MFITACEIIEHFYYCLQCIIFCLFCIKFRMKNFIVIFLSFSMFSPAISLSLNWFMLYPKSDPNDELNTLQMIRKEGYPAEAHVVLTEDGYILTMHRIPGKPGSPPILLQHGVLGSSADWVILGKGKALAYLLADRGYDVWFGNFRGNTYSRAHISLSVSDAKFWEFSWHESGVYDLPAMITYIVKVKQSLLKAYIGFSMGTTSFYVMSSERPQIARLVQSMYSLAPVGFMKHVQSPLRYLAPFATNYKMMLYLFGEGEFLPQSVVLKFLAKYLCYVDFLEEKICANSLFVIVGFDSAQFNYTLLPVILNHTPAGTSSKTMVHYAQEIESGYFRQYDYGTEKNLEIYNSTEPPKYDLSKITMPIALFCAENDWLSSPVDVMRLNAELPNTPTIYKVPFQKFNHIDYLWAKDAPKLVYDKLLNMLNETVL